MTILDLDSVTGLTSEQAAEKIRTEGYNELPEGEKHGIFGIIAEVVKEPMFILLVASGLIYLFLGDITESIMLLGFVFVIIGITVYQEQKTERALEALRNLSSPRALVIRDGQQKRIAGREVVTGDILLLAEGDRVPADGILLHSNHISVDESLLTGESVPGQKNSMAGRICRRKARGRRPALHILRDNGRTGSGACRGSGNGLPH